MKQLLLFAAVFYIVSCQSDPKQETPIPVPPTQSTTTTTTTMDQQTKTNIAPSKSPESNKIDTTLNKVVLKENKVDKYTNTKSNLNDTASEGHK